MMVQPLYNATGFNSARMIPCDVLTLLFMVDASAARKLLVPPTGRDASIEHLSAEATEHVDQTLAILADLRSIRGAGAKFWSETASNFRSPINFTHLRNNLPVAPSTPLGNDVLKLYETVTTLSAPLAGGESDEVALLHSAVEIPPNTWVQLGEGDAAELVRAYHQDGATLSVLRKATRPHPSGTRVWVLSSSPPIDGGSARMRYASKRLRAILAESRRCVFPWPPPLGDELRYEFPPLQLLALRTFLCPRLALSVQPFALEWGLDRIPATLRNPDLYLPPGTQIGAVEAERLSHEATQKSLQATNNIGSDSGGASHTMHAILHATPTSSCGGTYHIRRNTSPQATAALEAQIQPLTMADLLRRGAQCIVSEHHRDDHGTSSYFALHLPISRQEDVRRALEAMPASPQVSLTASGTTIKVRPCVTENVHPLLYPSARSKDRQWQRNAYRTVQLRCLCCNSTLHVDAGFTCSVMNCNSPVREFGDVCFSHGGPRCSHEQLGIRLASLQPQALMNQELWSLLMRPLIIARGRRIVFTLGGIASEQTPFAWAVPSCAYSLRSLSPLVEPLRAVIHRASDRIGAAATGAEFAAIAWRPFHATAEIDDGATVILLPHAAPVRIAHATPGTLLQAIASHLPQEQELLTSDTRSRCNLQTLAWTLLDKTGQEVSLYDDVDLHVACHLSLVPSDNPFALASLMSGSHDDRISVFRELIRVLTDGHAFPQDYTSHKFGCLERRMQFSPTDCVHIIVGGDVPMMYENPDTGVHFTDAEKMLRETQARLLASEDTLQKQISVLKNYREEVVATRISGVNGAYLRPTELCIDLPRGKSKRETLYAWEELLFHSLQRVCECGHLCFERTCPICDAETQPLVDAQTARPFTHVDASDILGIVAGRAFMLDVINELIKPAPLGAVELLADTLTSNGSVTSVRSSSLVTHGCISQVDASTIHRTTDYLATASMQGQVTSLTPATNIALGQLFHGEVCETLIDAGSEGLRRDVQATKVVSDAWRRNRPTCSIGELSDLMPKDLRELESERQAQHRRSEASEITESWLLRDVVQERTGKRPSLLPSAPPRSNRFRFEATRRGKRPWGKE